MIITAEVNAANGTQSEIEMTETTDGNGDNGTLHDETNAGKFLFVLNFVTQNYMSKA
jgi:hypothetical protein